MSPIPAAVLGMDHDWAAAPGYSPSAADQLAGTLEQNMKLQHADPYMHQG